jgi:hypothetical protein
LTTDRQRTAFDAVLVLALVLECVGALGVAVRDGSGIAQLGTSFALGAAVVVALGGHARAAWIVAAWLVIAALLDMNGDQPFALLALPSQAARFGVAIAIARPRFAIPILRVAASLTFLGHGIEAIGLHPKFVAYIQHAGGLVGWPVTAETTAALLRLIGTLDLVVATAILLRAPRRAAAGYMTVWGTITALARTVYAGPAGIPDTLVRAANPGGPLALWLSWRRDES